MFMQFLPEEHRNRENQEVENSLIEHVLKTTKFDKNNTIFLQYISSLLKRITFFSFKGIFG